MKRVEAIYPPFLRPFLKTMEYRVFSKINSIRETNAITGYFYVFYMSPEFLGTPDFFPGIFFRGRHSG